jgi:hypothetical protein
LEGIFEPTKAPQQGRQRFHRNLARPQTQRLIFNQKCIKYRRFEKAAFIYSKAPPKKVENEETKAAELEKTLVAPFLGLEFALIDAYHQR